MNGKFKVWDTTNKEWSPFHYYINLKGDLCTVDYSGRIMSCLRKDLIIVYSTGKNDKNGVELFDGDKAIGDHYKEECEVHFSQDIGCWFYGDILLFEELPTLEKTGSKYEC